MDRFYASKNVVSIIYKTFDLYVFNRLMNILRSNNPQIKYNQSKMAFKQVIINIMMCNIIIIYLLLLFYKDGEY